MNEINDRHFHMSGDYERHSASQQTIGQAVIESATDFVKSTLKQPREINALDLACGPGNLTVEFKRALEAAFPDATIKLTGLDYTGENVRRLVENSNGDIQGVVGSFYELPFKPGSEDIITSNEGLHWQPPHEMSEIIYAQLPPEEKAQYEAWALKNFKTALKRIHETLKEGGVAVLQFGHEGQLQKLWDLIRDTLAETQFQGYKARVNFPLYYPTEADINAALLEAGFTPENIEVSAFNQDLTEDTPAAITGFLKAFTKPGFSAFFKPDDLNDFYARIESKLAATDIDEFRKDQWHRTLVKVKK